MAGGFRLAGLSGLLADVLVDALGKNRLQVQLPTVASADTPAARLFSECDPGAKISGGAPLILSPETTGDFKLRMTFERLLDNETFNYTAQNTGKQAYTNTTMTAAWTTAGFVTNSGSVTTTTTGLTFGSQAEFPVYGPLSTYFQFGGGFTQTPTANVVIDFGPFRRGPTAAFAPQDGAYFRFDSTGVQGILNYNGVENATTGVFPNFTVVANRKYKFIVEVKEGQVNFWIDDELHGSIKTPVAQGQPFMSATLPISLRHAHVGTAGAVVQFQVTDWAVSQDSPSVLYDGASMGNVLFGGGQGLSGGTMGSLAGYANSANPAAAVPTNTTAALGTGLGGQFWETDTLAVTTDGIISSFQNPVGAVSAAGRRLMIYGVTIDSYIQTVLTGGGYNAQWSLAFGHTALSLATAEGATTKAPRRRVIGSNTVASAAAALTQLPRVNQTWAKGIPVNPGEFVAVVKKKVGTAPSAGVVAHMIEFDYGWE